MKQFMVFLLVVSFMMMGVDVNAQQNRKKRERNVSGTETASTLKSKISPAQQQNLNKLNADLNSIKAGSQVTSSQISKLQQDLWEMIDGATRPSQQSVEKLATDLANAWADGKFSVKEQAQLMEDISAVLNSANISQGELNAVIKDAQAILTASGISKSDVLTIVNDLTAIGNELQKNVTAVKETLNTEESQRKFPKRRK